MNISNGDLIVNNDLEATYPYNYEDLYSKMLIKSVQKVFDLV